MTVTVVGAPEKWMFFIATPFVAAPVAPAFWGERKNDEKFRISTALKKAREETGSKYGVVLLDGDTEASRPSDGVADIVDIGDGSGRSTYKYRLREGQA